MLTRRRADVGSAESLRPHDHTVWFGDDPDELYAVASAAFTEGMRRNEKLIFVAGTPDASKLQGIGVERLLEDGQLQLLDVRDVYDRGVEPSAGVQLATFRAVLADGLAEGYSGIRVVADNTTLVQGDDESFARWLAWEQLTDHFQAASPVTGICFFDRRALSAQRLADLAALHPMRMKGDSVQPPFSLFADGDAVPLVGSIGAGESERIRRLVATVDLTATHAIDLSAAQLLDDTALVVLSEFASPDRPLVLRGNDHLRRRVAALGTRGEQLRVEHPSRSSFRCTACGDVIGVYELASIVVEDETLTTSTLAAPEAVSQALARFHSDCYAEA